MRRLKTGRRPEEVRCLRCMEKMEEKEDLFWILGLRRFLCQDCRQKVFSRTKDLFRLKKPARFLQRMEGSRRSLMDRIQEDAPFERIRNFEDKKRGWRLRFQNRTIPILRIYESNDELQALWRQYANLGDYELRGAFLEGEDAWIEKLREYDLYYLGISDDGRHKRGWDPDVEAFGFWNLHLFRLLEKGRNEELSLTKQAALCAQKGIRKGIKGKAGSAAAAKRRTKRPNLLIAPTAITIEEIGERLAFLELALPDLDAEAVILLFMNEEDPK